MAVYFIHDDFSDMVKIGHSIVPWSRLSYLQISCPGELSMLGLEDGGRDREAELHLFFAPDRERGEWFRYGPRIREYVAALPPIQRRVRLQSAASAYVAVLHVPYQTAIAWVRRKSIPSQHWLALDAAGIHPLFDLAEAAARADIPAFVAPELREAA